MASPTTASEVRAPSLRIAPEETVRSRVSRICFAGCMAGSAFGAQSQDAVPPRPIISEDAAPLEPITPTAQDGSRGEGFLRKPPGAGPFPAVVLIHPGITRWPTDRLRQYAV